MASLRDQLARQQTQQPNRRSSRQLNELTSGGIVPNGTDPVTARVVGRSPTVWYSTVTIDKGSGDGVRIDDPVVAAQGLAGKVTQTTPEHGPGHPDHRRRQRSDRAGDARAAPPGWSSPTSATPTTCSSTTWSAAADIAEGQMVVTAGFSTGDLGSIFPPGDPDREDHPASVEEQQAYQRVHLSPFADLRDMDFVKVLTIHSGGGKK